MDWASVVVAAAALCVYSNTLDSDFVYDDNRAILANEDIRPGTPLSNLVLHDFWGTPLSHSGSHGSYRPLTVLSFRLNVLLSGGRLNARAFHGANVVLHAACAAALVRVARRLTASPLTPWAAGLLFALHPVHSEAVAGLVGRADVGAGLFLLLALLAYTNHVKFRDKPRNETRRLTNIVGQAYLILTVLLGMCSMLSKEQGVSVFVICVAYEAIYSRYRPIETLSLLIKRPPGKRKIEGQWRLVQCSVRCLVISFCLLAAFRTYLTGGKFPSFATADNPAAKSDSFLTRTLTFLFLPVFNFYLLLCPSTLSFDWSMDAIPLVRTYMDVRNLTSLVFYSVLLWIVSYHFVQLNRTRGEEQQNLSNSESIDVNFNHKYQHTLQKCQHQFHQYKFHHLSCSHVLSTTFPQYSYQSCLNSSISGKQRSNYNRCVFWKPVNIQRSVVKCFFQSESVQSHSDDSKVILMCATLIVVPFIPATNLVAYVGFVVAERVLYIPSLGYCLLVGHGLSTLAARRNLRGRLVAALAAMVLLVVLGARTVARNRDWHSEESLYRSGIAVNPPKAYGNLGNILSFKGNYNEAERCYRMALQHRPNMADAHYNLGVLLQGQQRFDEAIYRYRVAIQCRPKLGVAYLNLGIVLARVGRIEEAMRTLRKGSTLDGTGLKDPRSHELARTSCLFHLGRIAMDNGRLQEAVDVFQEAVAIRPPYYQPQSLFNLLGEAYSRLGRDADAEPWFRASLSSKPDHVPAHLTYGRLLSRNGTRVHEAEEWYSRAEELAPDDAAVFRHYGQFLLSQKRHREAVAKLERAMQLSTVEYEDAMNAATSLRLSGEIAKAEVYYKMAVRIRPQEASGVANLGALYHMTGRLQEAEACYREALELLPGDDVTQANLRRLQRLRASEEERQSMEKDAL